jgi:hypothetical protein
LNFRQKWGNNDKVVNMAMKAGGGYLFKWKVRTGLRIAVIGQQVMQNSLRCYTKRKQKQEQYREKTFYLICLFQ